MRPSPLDEPQRCTLIRSFWFPFVAVNSRSVCAHLWEGINYKNGEEDDDDDDNNRRYSDDTSPSTVSLAHVAEGRKRIPARGCDCLYQIIH